MLARAVTRLLDRVDPDTRRDWAARTLLWSLTLWAVSHLGLILLPGWFFEHVLLAISWAAIALTAVDVLSTQDVRKQEDGT